MGVEALLKSPEYADLDPRYHIYKEIMKKDVEFRLVDSVKHTKPHCGRVLFYSLLIARNMGLSEQEKEELALCSVFHDSRRDDDGYDVGHGQRGADYYKEFCEARKWEFDPRVFLAIAYHDRNDKMGIDAIHKELPGDAQAVRIYLVFKDADALDRFRIGEKAFDAKYLRTQEARELEDFARQLSLGKALS